MSYEIASKLTDSILELRFKITIADEAHYLKNFSSKRAKALVPLLIRMK